MNEQQFRNRLSEMGYDEPELREFEPGPAKDMHTHDCSVMLLVTRGVFTLITENESKTVHPGQSCENPMGTLHTEQIGPDGVTALVAMKHAST